MGPLGQIADFHQKLRNTLRFILGNLKGFDKSIGLDQLKWIDLEVMRLTTQKMRPVWNAFLNYEFNVGLNLLKLYIEEDLSAFYFDLIKNRLYLESPTSITRSSAQTALSFVLNELFKVTKVISPFLSAEVESHMILPSLTSPNNDPNPNETLQALRILRTTILRNLKSLQSEKALSSSYGAIIKIEGESPLKIPEPDLAEILMVGKVEFGAKIPSLHLHKFTTNVGNEQWTIGVLKSMMNKCDRCWIYKREESDEQLCSDCRNTIIMGPTKISLQNST